MKIVLWRAAKRLSYIDDARCLKVKHADSCTFFPRFDVLIEASLMMQIISQLCLYFISTFA